jgi:hypothetical protein
VPGTVLIQSACCVGFKYGADLVSRFAERRFIRSDALDYHDGEE